MNRLLNLDILSNSYYALRHGHSKANKAGIIVSNPKNGVSGYGLSKRGENQIEAAMFQNRGLGDDLRIISSDFLRAVESARIAHRLTDSIHELVTDTRLRERNFGDLELGPDRLYGEVWGQDRINADIRHQGSESANQVMDRTTSLVEECEHDFEGQKFLFVSHGDALQILQAAFQRRGAEQHRDLPHLETGEIRQLKLG